MMLSVIDSSRAAPDLEGAFGAHGQCAPVKASMPFYLLTTSPKRPPGGGRALPGLSRARHFHPGYTAPKGAA